MGICNPASHFPKANMKLTNPPVSLQVSVRSRFCFALGFVLLQVPFRSSNPPAPPKNPKNEGRNAIFKINREGRKNTPARVKDPMYMGAGRKKTETWNLTNLCQLCSSFPWTNCPVVSTRKKWTLNQCIGSWQCSWQVVATTIRRNVQKKIS